ncbi:hypothetical protein RIF29_24515 [Crotalaria pallida]|uniref:UBA domain-containing protein n=1 Tax=Crotalaria pallida TaxID=3830 RepID=A0AAN9HYZ9_CROPI
MSLASQTKSKDKKASKETRKAFAKLGGTANEVVGVPSSAYNALSGTLHTLEVSASSSTSPMQSNSRSRNIDETDEHPGGSFVPSIEYDFVSNHGSWCGESENHKEKASSTPVQPESVPGAHNEKREKNRQKNEKKHLRQKERRAQELHERCNGYLMSRKLDALVEQVVAMGFPPKQATMALMLNEARVEESVAWLSESGEENNLRDKTIGSGNLKIDISEELARVANMEIRFGCSKQEVERVIVSCKGDLDKAAKTLKERKHDPSMASPNSEETGDPFIISNPKQ